MKVLTKQQLESYEDTKLCYICREEFENKYTKDKIYIFEIIPVIIQVNIEAMQIAFVI